MALLAAFNDGGPFMYVILIFGLFSISFVIERGVYLYLKVVEAPANFREMLNSFLQNADLKGASQLALKNKSGVARVAGAGLEQLMLGGSEEHVQARMDEQLSREIQTVDRRTAFLAMFGNVATLVGLLGTITGMIHSFGAVASASPMDRATLLSKGISEAMNCTAFGLVVAVPALVAYAVYQNKTDRLITEMTNTVSEIYHDLVFTMDFGTTSVAKNNIRANSQAELRN